MFFTILVVLQQVFGASEVAHPSTRFFPSARDNRRTSTTVSMNSMATPFARPLSVDCHRPTVSPAPALAVTDHITSGACKPMCLPMTSLASVLPVVSPQLGGELHPTQSILALLDSSANYLGFTADDPIHHVSFANHNTELPMGSVVCDKQYYFRFVTLLNLLVHHLYVLGAFVVQRRTIAEDFAAFGNFCRVGVFKQTTGFADVDSRISSNWRWYKGSFLIIIFWIYDTRFC